MGDFQYFDIILFAMIAAFLVLRLRSVLGRRTGNERRRELFVRRTAPIADKPVPEKVATPGDPRQGHGESSRPQVNPPTRWPTG